MTAHLVDCELVVDGMQNKLLDDLHLIAKTKGQNRQAGQKATIMWRGRLSQVERDETDLGGLSQYGDPLLRCVCSYDIPPYQLQCPE